MADKKKRKDKPLWREYGEALIVALAIALFIRTFIVQAFKIPSGSMLETLQIGDHLLATKFAYGIKIPFTDKYLFRGDDPQRGDVVIFPYPNDPDVDYIKRIVGAPGDVIEIRDKQFYRNGQPIREGYVIHTDPDGIEPVRDNYGPVTIPADKYFVMGDNRDNSMDSRFWGLVDRDSIKAKAWRIYWSWGDLSDIRWDRIGKKIE
ncbi:MAG: signal peptidase I [Desulfovibrio sp.]|nr:signal peptidase I [Desulfovibrio sp.]